MRPLFVLPGNGALSMTNLTSIDKHARIATVAEMDSITNEHIYANFNDLNKTDRAVLDTIRRYSSIYRAAKIKVSTLAKLIGKSVITARRSTAKLERLGIIERIKTTRPINVGQGANIYVILPYNDRPETTAQEEDAELTESKPEDSKSEIDPLSFNYKPASSPLLHNTYPTELSPTLFQRFKSLLQNTIGDTSAAGRLYGVYRSQSIRLLRFDIHKDKADTLDALAMQALSISVQATQRKHIRNIAGFYSGTLNNLIDKSLFSDSYRDYEVPVELLPY